MARAYVTQELYLEAKNETGMLGRVTAALSMEGVYIIHLSAYSVGDRGYLQMVTKDSQKAKKALSHFISKIEEREVLIVIDPDDSERPTELCRVALAGPWGNDS